MRKILFTGILSTPTPTPLSPFPHSEYRKKCKGEKDDERVGFNNDEDCLHCYVKVYYYTRYTV